MPFRIIVSVTVVFILLPCVVVAQTIRLSPRLHVGQTLFYQLDFASSRTTKTESRVTLTQLPPSADLQASCLLQVYVLDASRTSMRLKTSISDRPAAAVGTANSEQVGGGGPDKIVELQIAADGTASNIKGLDQLSVPQLFVWNAWLARFTSSFTFPPSGVRVREKWQVTEPETADSPIAKLVWLKKLQYVRDEPCFRDSTTSSEHCAVVMVQARLRRNGSADNATPEDFRLHGLTTKGTARGTNETILYISKATGLLVRSTEDAQQSMNVTVALADGSNSVRYSIEAKSHSQVQLVPDQPRDVR